MTAEYLGGPVTFLRTAFCHVLGGLSYWQFNRIAATSAVLK